MRERWYGRPIIAVSQTARALDFYTGVLHFTEDWRHEEGNLLRIVQVSREGCELILSDQWPADAGRSRVFIELTTDAFIVLMDDFAQRSVPYTRERWGYDLVAVRDPDGSALWFPYPEGLEPPGPG